MGEKVDARIRVLESALRRLDEISAMSLEDFLKDRFAPAAAERSFQVAIEVVIDLANMLASKVGRRSPETYADVFRVLGEAGRLSPRLVEEGIGMARFRNLLVHAYATVDPTRVHAMAREKVRVLRELASTLAKQLEELGA